MRKLSVVISIVFLMSFLLAFAYKGFQTETLIRAEVDINSFIPAIPSKADETGTFLKAKSSTHQFLTLGPAQTILLGFLSKGAYLSDAKFDHIGNIYFMTYFPKERATLIRFNPELQEHKEVAITAGIREENLAGFEIDDQGRVYLSLNWRPRGGAIQVLDSDGTFLSRIETGSFLPAKIAVDTNSRIWVTGQLFGFSLTGSYLNDVQVRVYDLSGQLISVPAGGLDPNDSGMSTFAADAADPKLITDSRTLVYDFAGTRLTSAQVYPFHHSTDINQFKVEPLSAEPQRLVKGVTHINGLKLWYGNIKNNRGAYGRSFVGLTKLTGEPVSPEIILPSEYQALAGADSKGNIYAYSQIGEQITLKKVRISIK